MAEKASKPEGKAKRERAERARHAPGEPPGTHRPPTRGDAKRPREPRQSRARRRPSRAEARRRAAKAQAASRDGAPQGPPPSPPARRRCAARATDEPPPKPLGRAHGHRARHDRDPRGRRARADRLHARRPGAQAGGRPHPALPQRPGSRSSGSSAPSAPAPAPRRRAGGRRADRASAPTTPARARAASAAPTCAARRTTGGVHRPHRLEDALAAASGRLPADEARGVTRARRRSPPTRGRARRAAPIGISAGSSSLPIRSSSKRREHADGVGDVREPPVAVLDGAVVALGLEGGDHHRAGGARHRLLLDRPRERDQRRLAQPLRAHRARRPRRARRRSTAGRSAPSSERARSSAAGTDSPRSR